MTPELPRRLAALPPRVVPACPLAPGACAAMKPLQPARGAG